MIVWEEDINEEAVRWFSSMVADYKRKRAETRRKEFERIRTQGLIKDFPNSKVGRLLLEPTPGEPKLTRHMTREWPVIVALDELELQREAEIAHNQFYDKPDERGWIRHACCGHASVPSEVLLPQDKEWCGGHPH